MARRRYGRRRGGRRGFRIGKYVNLGFKLIGGYVALSPVIESASTYLPAGDIPGFGRDLSNRFTGSMGKNISQATDTYGRILAGLVIGWVGGKIARRL